MLQCYMSSNLAPGLFYDQQYQHHTTSKNIKMGFKVFNFYGGALLRPVAKADSDLSENKCCDTIEKKSAKQFSHEQFTAQTCQSICVWNSWHVVLQTSPYQGLNTISTFPDYRAAADDYVNYHVPMCDVRRRGRESWRLSIIKYNSYNLTSHRK